jgi:hypothetical protein
VRAATSSVLNTRHQSRAPAGEHDDTVPQISERVTSRCGDLFNVSYEILLQMMERYFAHTEETDAQLGTLADATIGLMLRVLEMGLRWTAAGMLEAEQQFRKIIGHTDLAKLAIAIEHDLHRHPQTVTTIPTQEAAIAITV